MSLAPPSKILDLLQEEAVGPIGLYGGIQYYM